MPEARRCPDCGEWMVYIHAEKLWWCDLCPEPTALAWTPDDEMERGTEEFKRLWPEKWQAWLDWCAEQDDAAARVLPPDVTD